MAKYEITLEFETVVSVNCIKHNTLPKLTKDVYTIFESKDSLNYIKEGGCCVTQLCNKLGKDASSFLQA